MVCLSRLLTNSTIHWLLSGDPTQQLTGKATASAWMATRPGLWSSTPGDTFAGEQRDTPAGGFSCRRCHQPVLLTRQEHRTAAAVLLPPSGGAVGR